MFRFFLGFSAFLLLSACSEQELQERAAVNLAKDELSVLMNKELLNYDDVLRAIDVYNGFCAFKIYGKT